MGDDAVDEAPSLSVYESVSCLECGTVYAKPTRGGTAQANPGCPECGYVGWVAVTAGLEAPQRRRSDADQRPGHSARLR
jgi:predicted  nucleic acid-binding Zn-ribbon protein